MSPTMKVLLIVLAVLGAFAIAVNVYFGIFKSPKKSVTAVDLGTGEVKKLTPEEARSVREEIIDKIRKEDQQIEEVVVEEIEEGEEEEEGEIEEEGEEEEEEEEEENRRRY